MRRAASAGAGSRPTADALENREAICQPRKHLSWSEQGHARGGELDCQREKIQRETQAPYGRPIPEIKVGTSGTSPIDEQVYASAFVKRPQV